MDDVTAEIAAFIRKNLLSDPTAPVGPDTALVTGGHVDSLGISMLGAFLEERFGVFLDETEIRAGGVESMARLADLVRQRR